ncbi:MAG TPA: hypothetical protein DCX07_00960 [Phycisphaerales bacterium]|nr:hypothetical protein [Phycisphaerales bacterium]
MSDFFFTQTDYMLYLSGLTLLLLAVACNSARHSLKQLPWLALEGFAVALALAKWIGIFETVLAGAVFQAARVVLGVAAFAMLLEFARAGLAGAGLRMPRRRWLAVPLALACAGALGGWQMLYVAAVLALALPGGMATAALFVRTARRERFARFPLYVAGGAMTLILLLTLLSEPVQAFQSRVPALAELHARLAMIPIAARSALVLVTAIAIGTASHRARKAQAVSCSVPNERTLLAVAGTALALLASVGWLATERLGRHAESEVRRRDGTQAHFLSEHLSEETGKIRDAAQGLAEVPAVVAASVRPNPETLAAAQQALVAGARKYNATVCYLLDASGTTVASSNHDQPDSFVGKNYAFRPHFQEALAGRPYLYAALGVTSAQRGFYGSCPVRDESGKPVAVLAVKKNATELESHFEAAPNAVLAAPHGVVFLAGKPELALKSLWPMEYNEQAEVLASRQFGTGPFPSVLDERITRSTRITLDGEDLLATRWPFNDEGWSVVTLSPMAGIRAYRLFGVAMVLLASIMLVGFTLAVRSVRNSAEAVLTAKLRYESLIEGSPNWVSLLSPAGKILTVNRAGGKILGRTPSELVGCEFPSLWPETSTESVRGGLDRALRGERSDFEARYLRADGREVVWSVSLNPVHDTERRLDHVVCIANDITLRKAVEEIAQCENAKLSAMISQMQEGVVFANAGNVVVEVNEFFCRFVRMSRQAVLGHDLMSCHAEPVRLRVEAAITGFREKIDSPPIVIQQSMGHAEVILRVQPIYRAGRYDGVLLNVIDVTELVQARRAAEEAQKVLALQATHDSLTGILNRPGILDKLQRELIRARREGGNVGLVMLDVDFFKRVNDTYGHKAGDEVLCEVVRRVVSSVRPYDSVGRYGGEEFLILLPGCDAEGAAHQAERIRAIVAAESIRVGVVPIPVTISAGVATAGTQAEIDAIIRQADEALYEAKHAGRNCVRVASQAAADPANPAG